MKNPGISMEQLQIYCTVSFVKLISVFHKETIALMEAPVIKLTIFRSLGNQEPKETISGQIHPDGREKLKVILEGGPPLIFPYWEKLLP